MTDSNPVKTSLWHSLHKNGFPEKSVKLPFRPVYQSARQHDISLMDTLVQLRKEGVVTTIEGNSLLFQTEENAKRRRQENTAPPSVKPKMMELLAGIPGSLDLLGQWAGKLPGNLSTESLAEMQKRLESLTPEEKLHWLNTYRTLLNMFHKT